MGRMELPFTSFNTTMGMLVTGSISNPRIFISTSMKSSRLCLVYTFSGQRIGPGARYPNLDVSAKQVSIRVGAQKIQSLVLRSSADPLAGCLVEAFHKTFFHRSDVCGIPPHLDGALPLLHDSQAAGLLFF